ncbi:hypothetical protein BZP36_24250 [Raoultella terrigena]|nr:hypothetical protein BZP36_24250 [Raoultella terrigena]
MLYIAAPGGLQKKQTFNSAHTIRWSKLLYSPPVSRINSEQNNKANDYPAFRWPFSTEVCRISLNFAYDVQEITSRCANVIVYAQSANIFVLR